MAVGTTAANRALLSRVWLRKVWSTTNPRWARSSAGVRALPNESEPHWCSAESQVARVPGMPTETPEVTNCGKKLYGFPVAGSRKAM